MPGPAPLRAPDGAADEAGDGVTPWLQRAAPRWLLATAYLLGALVVVVLLDTHATGRPYDLRYPTATHDVLALVEGDVRDEQLGQHGTFLVTAGFVQELGPVAARIVRPFIGDASSVQPARERLPDAAQQEQDALALEHALAAATDLVADTRRCGSPNRADEVTDPDPQLTLTGWELAGASCGLMTALAFVDTLGEGDLTGGMTVAGSGAITETGVIHPIMGLPQKVVGAHDDGAEVFFVPALNLTGWAETTFEGPEIVPVSTLSDALEWLCGNGASDEVCDSATTGSRPACPALGQPRA